MHFTGYLKVIQWQNLLFSQYSSFLKLSILTTLWNPDMLKAKK